MKKYFCLLVISLYISIQGLNSAIAAGYDFTTGPAPEASQGTNGNTNEQFEAIGYGFTTGKGIEANAGRPFDAFSENTADAKNLPVCENGFACINVKENLICICSKNNNDKFQASVGYIPIDNCPLTPTSSSQ